MYFLRNIVVLVLLLLAGTAYAQSKIYLQPRMSYGTFRMSSAKELQQTLIGLTGVNAKATDTFGANFLPGIGVKADLFGQAQVGLFYEQGASGGRVSYADYSGEIRVDMPVAYKAVGLIFDAYKPINNSWLFLVGGLEASYIRSTITLDIYSRLNNQTETHTDAFVADGMGLKPFIGLHSPILKLPLALTVGYMVHASGPFYADGNKEKYMIRNGNNDKLEPSWSGMRLNLVISIPIFSME